MADLNQRLASTLEKLSKSVDKLSTANEKQVTKEKTRTSLSEYKKMAEDKIAGAVTNKVSSKAMAMGASSKVAGIAGGVAGSLAAGAATAGVALVAAAIVAKIAGGFKERGREKGGTTAGFPYATYNTNGGKIFYGRTNVNEEVNTIDFALLFMGIKMTYVSPAITQDMLSEFLAPGSTHGFIQGALTIESVPGVPADAITKICAMFANGIFITNNPVSRKDELPKKSYNDIRREQGLSTEDEVTFTSSKTLLDWKVL